MKKTIFTKMRKWGFSTFMAGMAFPRQLEMDFNSFSSLFSHFHFSSLPCCCGPPDVQKIARKQKDSCSGLKSKVIFTLFLIQGCAGPNG